MIQEPPELAALLDEVTILSGSSENGANALNRIATALEQIALALIDQRAPASPTVAPQAPQTLAALPAVQIVTERPVCPKHGPAKVSPSTKFAGFYCTAKDDSQPRGFCSWQARQG